MIVDSLLDRFYVSFLILFFLLFDLDSINILEYFSLYVFQFKFSFP